MPGTGPAQGKQKTNTSTFIKEGRERERDLMGNETSRLTEGICEAAMAHYVAQPESGKQELRNKFTEIDSDGDGKVSPGEYSDYITERWYRSDLFDFADKNRDRMLDFDEFLILEFIQNWRGWTLCKGCSVILLGMYFVCVKCYDAGETYDLCCKCYGDKSYNHLDDHTYFRDIHSLLQLKKPERASAAYQRRKETEGIWEAAMAHYAAQPESGKQELRNKFTEIDSDGDGKVSPGEYSDYITERRYRSELFVVADKNRDGMLDFDEFLTLHFIYNRRWISSCDNCSVVLLGIYFVCVKCYEAGDDLYDLCCKCYGNKSYNHLDDHTHFSDIYSLLLLRKPKPASAAYQDPDQAKLIAGLNLAIITEKPNVKWNDVAGLESAKQALQEAVMLPVKFPQFFVGKRRPWRAFLLYGPPGTGKSHLAKATATEADSTFFSISSSDLLSKWHGESEKLVSNLFQMARDRAPSVIFIDEIDSLGGQRGEGNESETSRRIKTEILVQMQGVGHNDDKVLILAATNTPYALDQAIRRRFDRRIYIPLPDLKARQHMLKVHLGDIPHNLTESDFESLAPKTENFSGSDIAVCVKDVLFEPVRKTQAAMYFVKTRDDMWMQCEPNRRGAVQTTMHGLVAKGLASKITLPPITKMDFDKVLARQRPTVSEADLEVHERFTEEFGEEG